jgi:hypothetical protein
MMTGPTKHKGFRLNQTNSKAVGPIGNRRFCLAASGAAVAWATRNKTAIVRGCRTGG